MIEAERRLRARARAKVQYAIKSGRLQPPTSFSCSDCAVAAAEYDHHLGYEQENWLTVQPVCKECHVKRTMKSDTWKERKVAKKRPGRPSAAKGRVKFTTTLPERIVEALRRIGGGNASQGIITATDAMIDEHPSLKEFRAPY